MTNASIILEAENESDDGSMDVFAGANEASLGDFNHISSQSTAKEDNKDSMVFDECCDDSRTHDSSEVCDDSGKSRQGEQDGRWVKCSKVPVILFLVTTTTICSALTYVITSQAQERNFEKQVRSY